MNRLGPVVAEQPNAQHNIAPGDIIDLLSDSGEEDDYDFDLDEDSDIDEQFRILERSFAQPPAVPDNALRRPLQIPADQEVISLDSPSRSPSPPAQPESELPMEARGPGQALRFDMAHEAENGLRPQLEQRLAEDRPAPNRVMNPPYGLQQAIFGDYIDDGVDPEILAQYFDNLIDDNEYEPVAQAPGAQMPPVAEPSNPVEPLGSALMETKPDCIAIVASVFPGICLTHVSDIYDAVHQSSDRLIAYILDKIEKGSPYPKAKDTSKIILKRKRELDEDEEAAAKYGSADRVIPGAGQNMIGVRGYIRDILRHEFLGIPMNFIMATLGQCGFRLFSAYRVLEEAERNFDPDNPPYKKMQKGRAGGMFSDDKIPALLNSFNMAPDRIEVLHELMAARRIKRKADQKLLDIRAKELEEEQNLAKSIADGTMSECGCCYDDYPLNRMVHCDADQIHWFCRRCALKNAETEIGNSRFELSCMSMDGCQGGFSQEQRSQFLDNTTIIALERNEQEANLRLAGIENLASCPFCPYAAEYPPVEENKEFECKRPECEMVSCRLCKLESHIPKSCEENALEAGLSVRRQIEEAMSAAMIRKCNKCQTPFVKQEGCNKMTCTRNGCGNVQCYVCSKSCTYDHFDDRSRGGKAGNCPLFDSVEQRHDQEIKEAEKVAREKVLAEHPEYKETDLEINVSDAVKQDDERRRAQANQHPYPRGPPAFEFLAVPPGELDFLADDRGELLPRPFPYPQLGMPRGRLDINQIQEPAARQEAQRHDFHLLQNYPNFNAGVQQAIPHPPAPPPQQHQPYAGPAEQVGWAGNAIPQNHNDRRANIARIAAQQRAQLEIQLQQQRQALQLAQPEPPQRDQLFQNDNNVLEVAQPPQPPAPRIPPARRLPAVLRPPPPLVRPVDPGFQMANPVIPNVGHGNNLAGPLYPNFPQPQINNQVVQGRYPEQGRVLAAIERIRAIHRDQDHLGLHPPDQPWALPNDFVLNDPPLINHGQGLPPPRDNGNDNGSRNNAFLQQAQGYPQPLGHEERRIHRRQEAVRMKRDRDNDEVDVTARLAAVRNALNQRRARAVMRVRSPRQQNIVVPINGPRRGGQVASVKREEPIDVDPGDFDEF